MREDALIHMQEMELCLSIQNGLDFHSGEEGVPIVEHVDADFPVMAVIDENGNRFRVTVEKLP